MKKLYTKFYRKEILFAFLFLGILGLFTEKILSYPYGKTGHTATNGQGCYCHSSSANTGVSLALTGPTNVNVNTTNSYTLTVSQSLGKTLAGVGITARSSSNGTIINNLSTTDSYIQQSGSELIHRASPNNKFYSGTNVTFDFSFTAPATPGTYYIQAISLAANGNGVDDNGDVWNWLTPVAITVAAPNQVLSITSPTANLATCAGSNLNITWNSTNVTDLKIELSSDGGSTFPTTLITSTSAVIGNWMWSIAPNLVGTNFKVRLTDVLNPLMTSTSPLFSINVLTVLGEQPSAQNICQGSGASFRVSASGGNLTYQWRKNSAILPGTNSNTLTISNAVKGDEGSYDCIVTGSCGTPVTSTTAALTVKAPPTIETQPQGLTVCAGSSAAFYVTASGTNLNYQWIKDGVPIANAINSTLNIGSVTPQDSGNYICLVKGDCNPSATSGSVKLGVTFQPEIKLQPIATSICNGAKLELTTDAVGGNLTYTWKRNGLPVVGQTSSKLLIQNAGTLDEGTYTCQIYNNCGNPVTTAPVVVSVNKTVSILEQPAPKTATVGDDVILKVVIENGGSATYQWRKNNITIQGATSSTLTLKATTKDNTGLYDCQITAQCGGAIVSQSAQVTIKDKQSGPLLTLLSNEHNFDTVSTASTAKNMTLTGIVKNSGGSDLNITDINIIGNDANAYNLISDKSFTLKPNEVADLEFNVKPINPGLNTAQVEFKSNSTETTNLRLNVFGADIKVISVDGDVNYGLVERGTTKEGTITLRNNSNIAATIISAAISGVDKADFEFKDILAFPIIIPKDAMQEIKVLYKPTQSRPFNAQVDFSIIYKDNPLVVLLAGTSSSDVSDNISPFSFNNPAQDILKINSLNKDINTNIEIFDIYGIKLYNDIFAGSINKNIDISQFINGVYFIKINNQFYKFIKI